MDFLHENQLLMIQQEENWYNLRAKMIKLEHVAFLNEDGVLLEEGKKSFVENVKNILKNIKELITRLFKEFVKWFKSVITGTKIQDDKLRKLAEKKGITNITFKGFVYKNLESEIKKLDNTFLTVATTSSKKLTAKNFFIDCCKLLHIPTEAEFSNSTCFKYDYILYLLDHKEDKVDITLSVDDLIKLKNNLENRLDQITKVYNNANKNIESIINKLEQNEHIKNIRKTNGENSDGILKLNSEAEREMLEILNVAKLKAQAINIIFAEIIRAVKTETKQAKHALDTLKEK